MKISFEEIYESVNNWESVKFSSTSKLGKNVKDLVLKKLGIVEDNQITSFAIIDEKKNQTIPGSSAREVYVSFLNEFCSFEKNLHILFDNGVICTEDKTTAFRDDYRKIGNTEYYTYINCNKTLFISWCVKILTLIDDSLLKQYSIEYKTSILPEENTKLSEIVVLYKKLLQNGGTSLFVDEEIYKWEFITANRDSDALQIIDYLMTEKLNIYDIARISQCWKVLIKKDHQGLKNTIEKLRDESIDIHSRLATFKREMKMLFNGLAFTVYANDERTAACFLSCWYPDKYTLYKDENLYDPFCDYLGIAKKSAGNKYEHFLELAGQLATIIESDDEIQAVFSEKTQHLVQSNLLIAQTILWCVFSEEGRRRIQGRFYWSGGIKWGSNDMTQKFITGNYWEIGWKEKDASKGAKEAWTNIKRVRPGDYISFHSYGGTNDLTIHYLAEITKVDEKKGRVSIKEIQASSYYKGKAPKMAKGTWHGTLFEVTGIDAINTIFNYKGSESVMVIPDLVKEYGDILLSKKNVILQGAPGTGKTYSTAALSLYIIGQKESDAISGLDFNNHSKVMEKYEEYREKNQIGFCTFHQSMDYEDFVEGLRPEIVNDGAAVAYDVKPGIFKRICVDASASIADRVDNFDEVWSTFVELLNNEESLLIPLLSNKKNIRIGLTETGTGLMEKPNETSKYFSKEQLYNVYRGLPGVPAGGHDNYRKAIIAYMKQNLGLKEYIAGESTSEVKNYVLIIDEINRGYVSKIFGELITLLEKDKRIGAAHPIRVKLPYSNDMDFGVPSNLYIIGTMNTTDRTTGTLDYALRRRFNFITLEADPSVLSSSVDEAVILFNDVKAFIEAKKLDDMDISDLMVGHSYFMAKDTSELRSRIRYEVIPLIKEYIKDGILNCLPDEANEFFGDWVNLKPHSATQDIEE